MNKKIKIIELLNKIANREEVPKKIIFLNETLEYDIDCQDYKGFSKTGSGAFFSYLFTNEPTQNFINDRVEILEDNTEEIEDLKGWLLASTEDDYEAINATLDRFGKKINELVKRINYIERKINEN